jgi:ABC-2 type transport system permease protein
MRSAEEAGGELAARALVTPRRPVGGIQGVLRAVGIVWYRDLLRFWRDRSRVVGSLAQPLLFLVIFGTGLSSSFAALGGGLTGSGGGNLNYLQFMFPGIVGMAVLFSAVFGAMSIVWDREFGFLKEILVAPVDRGAVALGKILGGATQALIQGLILLVLAPVAGINLGLGTVVALLPFIFLLAFALASLGVAIASAMRTMQGFQIIMNFLLMPIFFLSGSLFPLTNLPEWMTVLTRLDPASYGMDPLRRIVLSGAGFPQPILDRLGLTLFDQVLPTWAEGAILLFFGLACLAVAVVNFQRRD